MERGLLSSDVVSEHDLHTFACKLVSKTCDFLDVPPVHLRGVHKTGLPVPLNLEGHRFAARGYLRPTVDQKTSVSTTPVVPVGDGAVHLGIALAQLPDKRVNHAIWDRESSKSSLRN